jgi:integrase
MSKNLTQRRSKKIFESPITKLRAERERRGWSQQTLGYIAEIGASDVSRIEIRRLVPYRHFYVSMLIDQGESPKYIQDQVGHAGIKTTFNTYGHLMPQSRREAAAKLERAVLGENASVRTSLENTPQEAQPERVN